MMPRRAGEFGPGGFRRKSEDAGRASQQTRFGTIAIQFGSAKNVGGGAKLLTKKREKPIICE